MGFDVVGGFSTTDDRDGLTCTVILAGNNLASKRAIGPIRHSHTQPPLGQRAQRDTLLHRTPINSESEKQGCWLGLGCIRGKGCALRYSNMKTTGSEFDTCGSSGRSLTFGGG